MRALNLLRLMRSRCFEGTDFFLAGAKRGRIAGGWVRAYLEETHTKKMSPENTAGGTADQASPKGLKGIEGSFVQGIDARGGTRYHGSIHTMVASWYFQILVQW